MKNQQRISELKILIDTKVILFYYNISQNFFNSADYIIKFGKELEKYKKELFELTKL